MTYNELKIEAGKWYLMQDVDRYSDAEFSTLDAARAALAEAIDDGKESMWIAYAEAVDENRVELIFEEGAEA